LFTSGEREFVHLRALEEARVTRINDLHLLEHLTDDDLDMLVVDLHALEPVHFLNLVQEVFLSPVDAVDTENVVRVDRAFRQTFARMNLIAVENKQMLAVRNHVLAGEVILAADDNPALTADESADLDDTVNFGDDRRVFRLPGLKEFCDARQTARDVAGLEPLGLNHRERFSGTELVAVLDDNS
jgi:hypothetical protein